METEKNKMKNKFGTNYFYVNNLLFAQFMVKLK